MFVFNSYILYMRTVVGLYWLERIFVIIVVDFCLEEYYYRRTFKLICKLINYIYIYIYIYIFMCVYEK